MIHVLLHMLKQPPRLHNTTKIDASQYYDASHFSCTTNASHFYQASPHHHSPQTVHILGYDKSIDICHTSVAKCEAFFSLAQPASTESNPAAFLCRKLEATQMCTTLRAHPAVGILRKRFVQNIFIFSYNAHCIKESENAELYQHLSLSNSSNKTEKRKNTQR